MSNEKAEDGLDSNFADEVQAASDRMKLRGRKLTATLSFVAGTGFILFGSVFLIRICSSLIQFLRYDQGVMSALLTANQVCVANAMSR